jgi:hypothetical protein
MIDGIAGNAFSAITLPPKTLNDTEKNAEKIVRVSREKYAKKRNSVEEKIHKGSAYSCKIKFLIS